MTPSERVALWDWRAMRWWQRGQRGGGSKEKSSLGEKKKRLENAWSDGKSGFGCNLDVWDMGGGGEMNRSERGPLSGVVIVAKVLEMVWEGRPGASVPAREEGWSQFRSWQVDHTERGDSKAGLHRMGSYKATRKKGRKKESPEIFLCPAKTLRAYEQGQGPM